MPRSMRCVRDALAANTPSVEFDFVLDENTTMSVYQVFEDLRPSRERIEAAPRSALRSHAFDES